MGAVRRWTWSCVGRELCPARKGARNPACTISGSTSSFHCANSSLYLTHEIGQLAELIHDLVRRSHQRIAAVSGDEMRLVLLQRRGIERLVVQPKYLQEV